MATQAEKRAVALGQAGHAGVGQIVARTEQRRRGAMFEAAVAVADGGDEEHVARHRRRFAEEADLPFADALEVARQPAHVAIVAAGDHHLVRDAAGVEGGVAEMAHFDRVVDQLVVILGAVEAKTVTFGLAAFLAGCAFRGQCGGDAPILEALALRRLDVDQAG